MTEPAPNPTRVQLRLAAAIVALAAGVAAVLIAVLLVKGVVA
jgi:hypothetical protein